jgi:redox-sensitive bicupin YhaK (pirin superfamily)
VDAVRKIKRILKSRTVIEGAGVKLNRVFGYNHVKFMDPFLLLDDFHSNNPDDYIPGFPWHPHRGIETITYMHSGRIEHGDSMGNKGVINAGDVQWMTAGNGIIHQEMPKGEKTGAMWGFQLWANLPASHKTIEPKYRDVKEKDIPEVEAGNARVKIICGNLGGKKGPVHDIVIDPEYLDITVEAEKDFAHKAKAGHTVFAYVMEGDGVFDDSKSASAYEVEPVNYYDLKKDMDLKPGTLALYGGDGDVCVTAGKKGVRFLLVSGRPLNEPIAWWGPIVMNTEQELQQALEEYNNGTFLKHIQKK